MTAALAYSYPSYSAWCLYTGNTLTINNRNPLTTQRGSFISFLSLQDISVSLTKRVFLFGRAQWSQCCKLFKLTCSTRTRL